MAQAPNCSPVGYCDSICPDPQIALVAMNNELYSEVITIKMDTSGFSFVMVDSVVLTSVSGLPPGISWEAGCGKNSKCKLDIGMLFNCIVLSGTPTSIGIYNVTLSNFLYVHPASQLSGPSTDSLSGDFGNYILRVTETPLRFSSQTTDVSSFGNCDGAATVSVTGGKAPYTYKWSSGETTASISGKCSDKYTFIATDSTGIKDSTHVYISEPYYAYNTCPPHTTPPADTIITNLDTCIIDYNYPIDSISMSSYTQTDSTNAIINFEIYQNGQKVTFSANFKYDTVGMTFIELNLQCSGTFAKMLRTTTIQGGIDFQYENIGIPQQTNAVTATSISRNEAAATISAFPNPFGDQLTIEVEQASVISIIDVNGKEVLSQNVAAGKTMVNTANYSAGTYILSITNKGTTVSRKLIKE